MTVVADNLPGYMQYLDLIRDCIEIFSLEPLPPNVVQHVFSGFGGRSWAYAGEDNRLHRKDGKSEKFDLAERNKRLLTQGRKRRSKRSERASGVLEESGSAASEMTQLLQDSLLTSDANSSSQLHLEQNSNEEDSSPIDSAPGSED
jgi:hypothetical protein